MAKEIRLERVNAGELAELLPASEQISRYVGPDGIMVIRSLDDTPEHGKLWHVSISKPHEYPSWDEILAIREQLFPENVDCMMVMPTRDCYVNVHKNCFHIWQTPEKWNLM